MVADVAMIVGMLDPGLLGYRMIHQHQAKPHSVPRGSALQPVGWGGRTRGAQPSADCGSESVRTGPVRGAEFVGVIGFRAECTVGVIGVEQRFGE